MPKNIIITGAMGSGKSTLCELLRKDGLLIVQEPAREILAEQRRIDGEGVPEKNPKLFTQLLLSRAVYQYKQMQKMQGIVIFDRGIPDNIAYAELFKLDTTYAQRAAKLYLYEKNIFTLPAWKDIYKTDDERHMTFDEAKSFGLNVQKIYKSLGYNLI